MIKDKINLKSVELVLWILVIISLGINISCEYTQLHIVVKYILRLVINNKSYNYLLNLINIDTIQKIFNSIFRNILYVAIIFSIIVLVFRKIMDKYEKNKLRKSDNSLNGVIMNYLDGNERRVFVLSGAWGSGKTHSIKEFFKRYSKYNNVKPHYISCFGISTRNELIDEIKLSYEKDDDRLIIKLLEFIKSIPFIGEGIYKLCKPKYDFNSMKKGSIFIFDDFERIISDIIYENRNIGYYNTKRISRNHNDPRDISDIKKVIEELQSKVSYLYNQNIDLVNLNKYEKLNIITGIINEINEIYEMKVIIICNYDKLDKKFSYEVFDGKMSSIKYKVKSSDESIRNTILSSIEKLIYLEDKKVIFIKKLINNEIENIIKIWKVSNVENLRVLGGIIAAFIDFVELMDIEKIDGIERDVFYSILIAHISYFRSTMDCIKDINIGENVVVFNRKIELKYPDGYGKENNKFKFLELCKETLNIRWIGHYSSYYWILGERMEDEIIEKELSSFRKNNYGIQNSLALKEQLGIEELKLIISKENKFNLEDVFYAFYMLKDKNDDLMKNILQSTKCVSSHYNSLSDIENLLTYMDTTKSSYLLIDEEFKNIIFEKILKSYDNVEKLYEECNRKYSDKGVYMTQIDSIEIFIEWCYENKLNLPKEDKELLNL